LCSRSNKTFFIPIIIIIARIMSSRIIPRPSDVKRIGNAGPLKIVYGGFVGKT